MKPRITNYRSCKYFSNEAHKLSKNVFVTNDKASERFSCIYIDASKKNALRKKGDSQVNQMPFKTKDFSRVVMNKSTFRNSFLNNRTD